jgi:hypothetical protein
MFGVFLFELFEAQEPYANLTPAQVAMDVMANGNGLKVCFLSLLVCFVIITSVLCLVVTALAQRSVDFVCGLYVVQS